ncbi:MAG: alkyl/aryl-sulfatase [Acidimicrobiales bacterium]
MSEPANSPKPATETTRESNAAAAVMSFDDAGDFERARRGLIATHETGRIEANGHAVWDIAQHDFVREADAAPETVHPGLWRQAKLNAIHGLFEVADGVWQARGYDISNITFMDTTDGWLIIDPLTTASTASACLELANSTLGERPVSAIIYTHSHVDHFGGVLGVTTADTVDAGDVRIIAPDGFLREVVNENGIGGPIMGRRAAYQFGPLLPPGPRGQVDCGLGQAIPFAAPGLLAPTETVTATGEELDIGGIRVVFQNTPNAEAPAEMNFFFPDKSLLCMAENCTHNMHNLYPIRGAQTRDSLAWSKYIHEALRMWGDRTDTMFASHHWPRFGREDVRQFLELQRDVYRWLHDQTMRLANAGLTPTEIAEELELPEAFTGHSHVRGYYGTVSHNVKSVYNRYLGWYDGNPANLNPHPPVASADRYVDYMGGAEEILRKAQRSFDEGEYRWVAQVVNHVVFADPTNTAARQLQADALEQLGYQAESGTWRNAYLMGAQELRQGSPNFGAARGRQLAHAMTGEQLVDMIGIRFNAEEFDHDELTINVHLTDIDEHHVLGIARCAVHHDGNYSADSPDVSISITRESLAFILGGLWTLDDALNEKAIDHSGDLNLLRELIEALDVFETARLIEP